MTLIMNSLYTCAMYKRLTKEKTLLGSEVVVEEKVPVPQTYRQHFCWKLRIPYKNTNLLLFITFPRDYPFKEPVVKVLEPIGALHGICCCHGSDGTLCMSGFLDRWGPSWTISRVLTRLHELLANASPLSS